MNPLFYLLPALILGWTVWGVVDYAKLKLALKKGDRTALIREYRLTIIGEIVGGFLALFAIGVSIFHPLSSFNIPVNSSEKSIVGGVLVGIIVSMLVAPLLAKQKGGEVTVGDIEPLLPKTSKEKHYFAGMAISAGICEELIFRGFGLRLLHSLGLTGIALLVVAALIFGLAHAYQGLMGVIVTTFMGMLLAVVYIVSGSLLAPMLLHVLIDSRPLFIVKTGRRE